MVGRVTRLRRVAVGIAVSSGLAAAIVIACGPGDLSDLTRGRRDAGVAPEVDAADAAICNHASAPPRPTAHDGPNVPALVFAYDAVRFDNSEQDGGPPKPQGLDLDMTCTCADPMLEPESCIPFDASAKRPCDGVDGRDNAAGPLLAAAGTTGKGSGPALFASQVLAGKLNVITTLSGWNGLPDDPAVLVSFQLSGGIEDAPGDGGRPMPKFDGTDVWTITPTSVLGGADLLGKDCRDAATSCIAAKTDTTAYVSGGVLVAHLDIDLPIVTSSGAFTIEFSAATVTATLTKEGNFYRVTGEIDGRWPIEHLLPSLARIPNPISPSHPLCASDSGLEIYNIVKQNACAGMDITANPALDRTSAPCDAISNAITFTGVSATVGSIVDMAKGSDECVGFQDTCAKQP